MHAAIFPENIFSCVQAFSTTVSNPEMLADLLDGLIAVLLGFSDLGIGDCVTNTYVHSLTSMLMRMIIGIILI